MPNKNEGMDVDVDEDLKTSKVDDEKEEERVEGVWNPEKKRK